MIVFQTYLLIGALGALSMLWQSSVTWRRHYSCATTSALLVALVVLAMTWPVWLTAKFLDWRDGR